MAVGRPSDYSQEKADAICERLADGESLRSICASDGMPSRAAVFRWLGAHAEFRDQYARARDEQAEQFADELTHIADTDEDVQRARLRIDTRKWVVSKIKPRKYGDKLDLNHSGDIATSLTVVFKGVDEPSD